MERNAFIKLILSFILFIWFALGSFSFILNETITTNYQTKHNQEMFIKEVNHKIQNYSLGANLPKNVLDVVITKSEIKEGPEKIDYRIIKKRMIAKINQYQAENVGTKLTEVDKENINKVADEIINKIKGEINTSFLFFNQTVESIVPILTTFTSIMSINAMITIILLFALFKKKSFIYLGYSLWSTAILLASMLISLRLIPFDHLAISRQTNSDVFTDITNYFSTLSLVTCIAYFVVGSMINYFGNKNSVKRK
ncbi:hypothetical protein AB1I58_03605 [Enterococcus hirae]|uniref:hypothetical protein n=1 Tax=Enterococcus hirae TaxID=1354 RepID=UPI001D45D3BF|nr:hypothetical protein [Enterococcus hirae]